MCPGMISVWVGELGTHDHAHRTDVGTVNILEENEESGINGLCGFIALGSNSTEVSSI